MILKTFFKDDRGNIGVVMALTIGAVLMGTGVAVDTIGVHNAKQKLQLTLDMALLAAATDSSQGISISDASAEEYSLTTYNYMVANGYDSRNPIPVVQIDDSFLTANLTSSYSTAFAGVIGKDEIDISVMSQVTLVGGSKIQIALVLDNTKSMNSDGKMTALKSGAVDLVNAIEDGGSQSEIAIVPFARYVRIDTSFANSPWLSVPAEFDWVRTWQQATHTGGNCTIVDKEFYNDGVMEIRPTTECTDVVTTYETQTKIMEARWEGCVGYRDQPLDSVDSNYTTPLPALLNKMPYEVTGLSIDTSAWCPKAITPLTNDYAELRSEINNLYGTDATYIPSGLSWGEKVLSPIAPFDEGAAADTVQNIMVIMSDGMNTAEIRDTPDMDLVLKAPPYLYASSTIEAVPEADALTVTLCNRIKAQGTEIYTIAFDITDTATKAMLQNCASSTEQAFVAGDNDGLIKAFGDIAKSLESEIRISM